MRIWFKSVILTLYLITVYTDTQQNDVFNDIENRIEKLTSSKQIEVSLIDAIEKVNGFKIKNILDETYCKSCQLLAKHLLTYRRAGANKESMRKCLRQLCYQYFGWGKVGCDGLIDIQLDSILFMIDNRVNMTAERICSIYDQEKKCVDPDALHWEITLPPKTMKKEYVMNKTQSSTLNILQLTDFHYDPLYLPGSNAVCSEPLCCHSGTPATPETAAGYWGDYHVCDMPKHTVENVLQNIAKNHLDKIDFVYFTGDIVSHIQWMTSRETSTKTIETLFELFSEAFPGKRVFPILGNHEPHPADFYSPEEITQEGLSTKWVLELAAEQWLRWLPDETRPTILKGGYYTVLVKPGFRIIALNSNVCFTNNYWLYYDDVDPYGQLSWLVEELYKAEQNNENVHILSHVPPGETWCHRQWSNQFRKIVERFSHTIAAQFNGHTHVDEFRVFYDSQSKEVTNIAFNGGGFTTFKEFNPNYKIYQVDGLTGAVQNYDQYIFNLTRANENSSPEWYKHYSFKEAYNLPDLSPKSIDTLLKRFSENENLLYQYFRFLVKSSDLMVEEGCDKQCLKKLLCKITAVETDLSVNC